MDPENHPAGAGTTAMSNRIENGAIERDPTPQPSSEGRNLSQETWERSPRAAETPVAPVPDVLDFAQSNIYPDEGRAGRPLAPVRPGTVYSGEGLNFEVRPAEIEAAPGDNLSKIARDHLGPTVSESDVQRYVREIQQANQLQNADRIFVGQRLSLPGHTADGAFVVERNGGTTTTWADGRVQFRHIDGRSYERVPGENGSWTQIHNGVRPEDNFVISRNADGRYFLTRPGEGPQETTNNPAVRAEHRVLSNLADQKILDPGLRARFEADMSRFEQRAREQGLSNEEVAKTYREIAQLMSARNGVVPENRRIELAQQVMAQAADPRTIDQGSYNTCNVTAVEAMIYSRDPSKAANLITQVALRGSYRSPEGQVVRLDSQSLTPRADAAEHPPSYDGDRSFATQLFNVTAINLAHRRQGNPLTYVQETEPADKTKVDPRDNGERLFKTVNGRREEVARVPGLDDDGIVEAYWGITGRRDRDVMIDHVRYVDGPGRNVETVDSPQALSERLARLQREGKLPVIIGIHSANEPFYSDSSGGEAGGSGGGHVVTVTHFDAGPPARVAVDNQWGSRVDHRAFTMTVDELFVAMQRPRDSVNEFQRIVDQNRERGQINTFREFDLVRMRREAGLTDDAGYGRELATRRAEAEQRWEQQRRDGSFNQKDQDQAMRRFDQMYARMTPEQRFNYLDEAQKQGLISASRADAEIAGSMVTVLNQKDVLIGKNEFSFDRQIEFSLVERGFNKLLDTLTPDRRTKIEEMVRRIRGHQPNPGEIELTRDMWTKFPDAPHKN
jgi:hypothetical protein